MGSPSNASKRGLEWSNFFLADVQTGLGPYLAIFLIQSYAWSSSSAGWALSIMSIATLAAQTPIGAYIDTTKRKRTLIVVATLAVAVATVVMERFPQFWVVMAGQTVTGVAAAVFAPALAAITLGVMGPKRFTNQIGRNQAFNHAGNVSFALMAAGVGTWLGMGAIFYQTVAWALVAGYSISWVRKDEINDDMASGLTTKSSSHKDESKRGGFAVLLESRAILVFTACVTLFHFANAAMLPLVGQELAKSAPQKSAFYMSMCIILAQGVMIFMALLVGKRADRWGRKPLFLAGFAILPIRGILYSLGTDPIYLLAVQALDGVGAGIFGSLFPIVLADLTRGTGRFNLAQGAVSTVMGIGISLSNVIAGYIVDGFGYNAAWYFLAAVASVAFVTFLLFMPETRPKSLEPHDAASS